MTSSLDARRVEAALPTIGTKSTGLTSLVLQTALERRNPMAASFATDILPKFTATDIDHMKKRKVLLSDYAWMSNPAGGSLGATSPNFPDHAHARAVYCYLTGDCQPQMPMGAEPWSPEWLQTYEQWMNDGFRP